MALRQWLGVMSLAATVAACGYLLPGAGRPPNVGDPPAGGFECVGVVPSKCNDFLNEARARGPVAAIRIRCLMATCTDREGEVEITVWRPGGNVEQSGAGWMAPIQAPPIGVGEDPTPPVLPMCLGVPLDWCHQLASQVPTELEPGQAEQVQSISVRCTGTCSASSGEGVTVVVLRDGQRHETGWGYDGTAP
jgi:hypothetical protein